MTENGDQGTFAKVSIYHGNDTTESVLDKIESTVACHGRHPYPFISSYMLFSDTPDSGKSG
jgi:hypothetical protein